MNITASTVAPREQVPCFRAWVTEPSVKFVHNCEQRLFPTAGRRDRPRIRPPHRARFQPRGPLSFRTTSPCRSAPRRTSSMTRSAFLSISRSDPRPLPALRRRGCSGLSCVARPIPRIGRREAVEESPLPSRIGPTSRPPGDLTLRTRAPGFIAGTGHRAVPVSRRFRPDGAAAQSPGARRAAALRFRPDPYQELPEAFMEPYFEPYRKVSFNHGAGSEGALTKGPFNSASADLRPERSTSSPFVPTGLPIVLDGRG